MGESSVSQISSPRHAVSAESWPASCTLCLQQKCKGQKLKKMFLNQKV